MEDRYGNVALNSNRFLCTCVWQVDTYVWKTDMYVLRHVEDRHVCNHMEDKYACIEACEDKIESLHKAHVEDMEAI